MKIINNIAITSFAFALVACGGGGSSSSPAGSVQQVSKKEFGYSDFDYNNIAGDYTLFTRTDYQIVGDVLYSKPVKNIIGKEATDNFSTSYLADSKTIKSYRPISNEYGQAVSIIKDYDSEKGVTLTPYNSAKDTSFQVVGKYTVKDLSGVSIKDSLSQELKSIQSKLPSSLVFPNGSKCRNTTSGKFITPNANEAVVFLFDEDTDSKTRFTTLADWRTDIASKVTINQSSTVTGLVAGKYKVEGFRDTSGNAYTGVLYNGKVYNAGIANTAEKTQAFEECKDYNKVAADFIEKTVKTYN